MIQLYQGDCLEVMNQIPDNSVDCIITSPPYDNLRDYNNSCVWNFEIFKKIAKELTRVLKKGGVIVWIVNDSTIKGSESGSSFKQALFFKEQGLNLHDTMIWFKPNCFNFGSNNCYKQSFEYMFVFSKEKPKNLHLIEDVPTKLGGKKLKGVRKHADGTRDIVPDFVCKEHKKRYNVWSINVESKNYGHPAVFPLSLVKDHIISWTNENDIVLDPFMGSGTTGVACKHLNRNFIGIELDPNYFEIAKNRIENEPMQLTSTEQKDK